MTAIGDPAGMRTAAVQLRLRAEQLAQLAADVDARTESIAFRGPAADRWRAGVTDQTTRLRLAGTRIAGTADALARGAARVEEEQRLNLLAGGL